MLQQTSNGTLNLLLHAADQRLKVNVTYARRWLPPKRVVVQPTMKYANGWYLCGLPDDNSLVLSLNSILRVQII
ncbi:MAG: hypothetical protein AB1772_00020 [Candidatus Zixiibacteriota bacterium]